MTNRNKGKHCEVLLNPLNYKLACKLTHVSLVQPTRRRWAMSRQPNPLEISIASKPNDPYAVPVQVSVPANSLMGISLNSRAQVTIAQGFTAPEFTVSVNGSGDVYALGVSTQTLTVNLRGYGLS